MLYNLIKINFIDRVMIVKYLSYSLGYRQPSTVNHEINLFFAKFLYKLVQLFFNIIHCKPKKFKAWQSTFKKFNFNNFEIISLLDYGFCYNYGFNHNENNLKNYHSSVNENYNFAFGENCNFVKSFNYDFINIESKNYNLSKIGNYNSLNGSCYGFWRIYCICDNLKDFLFNTKNQKKF